jgi:hypothetical protein
MWQVVTSKEMIKNCHQTLIRTIGKHRGVKCDYLHHEEMQSYSLWYFEEQNIWFRFIDDENHFRYSLGVGSSTMRISVPRVQMSVAKKFNRNAAGVYLIDQDGNIALGYRGCSNFGRDKLLRAYEGEIENVEYLGKKIKVILVSLVEAETLESFKIFIKELEQAKMKWGK